MSSRSKILQVTAIDTTIHFLLRPLVDHLDANGYDVHIACSPGPHTPALQQSDYQLHSIPIARRILAGSHLSSIWKLYRLMRQEKFDAVHVHTPVASILGRIAAKLAGVKMIIYTAHGFYFHDQMPPWKQKLLIWVEKLFGRCCTDWLWTVNQEDLETAIKHHIVKLKDQAECLNSIGVNIEKFQITESNPTLKTSLGLEEEDLVVGFVGRLVREKGIFELIEAMSLVNKEIPQAKLLVIGDALKSDRDGASGEVELLIEKHQLRDTVIFAGMREDIPELMQLMDVFTLPSYREGMPVVSLEAMASHLPVVATNIRGCREEVVEGVTGLLVPTRNVESLAQALIELLKNPEKAKIMGEAGYQRVCDVFDERIILKRQSDRYRQLIG